MQWWRYGWWWSTVVECRMAVNPIEIHGYLEITTMGIREETVAKPLMLSSEGKR